MGTEIVYESILFRTIQTIATLLSIFYMSFLIKKWTRRLNPRTVQILLGFYFGIISCLLIWINLYLRNSDLIDAKLVMIGIISTFFGIITAGIALIMIVICSIVIYGTSFAVQVLVLALVSCTLTGYVLWLLGRQHNGKEKMWQILNLIFGSILSMQAVIWKYLILNLSGMKISLIDSGLHKAIFFLLISFSVGLILKTELEIEKKTRDLEKVNSDLNVANKGLTQQKRELQDAYEQLAASEEELRAQNEEIQDAYERIAKSEEEFETLFNVGNEVLWRSDYEGNKLKYSERLLEMFGYKIHEANEFEENRLKLLHPDDAIMVEEYEQNLISGRVNQFVIEYRMRHKNGRYIWVRVKSARFMYKNGQEMGLVGSILDITQVKEYEHKILDMAYTDSLTRLPNRRALIEKLEAKLKANKDGAIHGVLFFIDTDNFKYINDLLGHNAGDDILRETGDRLRLLADSDNWFISRVGGDEFVIVLYGSYDREEINRKAKVISEAFSTPYEVNGRMIHLTISMGITVYPEDGRSVEKLLKNADIAMYNAKERGKDGWCFFENRLEIESSEKIMMMSHLRKAVENREVTLFYQPQVNILENSVVGFEALVRWNSPIFGMVSPVRFIPLAEETGIIIQLGRWVLREACLFSKELNKEITDKRKYVSVNISPLEIMQLDFLETVQRIIRETEIEPDMLGIEITETALLESFRTVAEKIDILRRKGIRISLDDFGMGFSSLNHLRTLPINTVKIDKLFIDDLLRDDRSRIMTEGIIRLSHKLGVDIVAEGVEQENQVELLKELNCDNVQGYFYSRPIPRDDALRFLSV